MAKIISKRLNCLVVAAEDNPILTEFDTILFVIPNVGDEELPPLIEDYLLNLIDLNKKYMICELGNYFGFENYCGCKKIASKILDSLNWEKISDVSIDSLPKLDEESLFKWLDSLNYA